MFSFCYSLRLFFLVGIAPKQDSPRNVKIDFLSGAGQIKADIGCKQKNWGAENAIVKLLSVLYFSSWKIWEKLFRENRSVFMTEHVKKMKIRNQLPWCVHISSNISPKPLMWTKIELLQIGGFSSANKLNKTNFSSSLQRVKYLLNYWKHHIDTTSGQWWNKIKWQPQLIKNYTLNTCSKLTS